MPMNRPGSGFVRITTPSRAATAAMNPGRATHPNLAAEALGVGVCRALMKAGTSTSWTDGGDHDGCERRLGEVFEQPGQEEQRDDGQARGEQPRDLRAAAGVASTAVLERLPLTTMPLHRPEARLALPSADQLPRLASMRWASTGAVGLGRSQSPPPMRSASRRCRRRPARRRPRAQCRASRAVAHRSRSNPMVGTSSPATFPRAQSRPRPPRRRSEPERRERAAQPNDHRQRG